MPKKNNFKVIIKPPNLSPLSPQPLAHETSLCAASRRRTANNKVFTLWCESSPPVSEKPAANSPRKNASFLEKKNGDHVKLEVENRKWMFQLVSCEFFFLSIHTKNWERGSEVRSCACNELPPPTTLTLGWTLHRVFQEKPLTKQIPNHQGRDIHPTQKKPGTLDVFCFSGFVGEPGTCCNSITGMPTFSNTSWHFLRSWQGSDRDRRDGVAL